MPTAGLPPNNVITYNAVIAACAKGEQWKNARALLAEMTAVGLTPDVITYSSAIDACSKEGQ